ncbi:MAG TPA: L-histidine N(alpha)-methyltransferase [Polyangiales bacterium]|nr:L-histidine N(alpha)-methyltransferase [Polyangiales bacterium]
MRRTNVTSVSFAVPEPATQERTQKPRTVTQVRADFRNQVISGLREKPRRLSSVYFYDDQGSALFDEITRLPEYYLTRAEHSILETHADDIDDLIGHEACCVVDLGAGSGDKTQVILSRMRERERDVRYAPVDVSAAALWSAEQSMQRRLPGLRVDPVHDDYIRGISRVRAAQQGRRLLVLWLGSSIGNFNDTDAVSMLRGLSEVCGPEDVLLVGFDLLKDPAALVAAYADSQGVTAEFNYNLLRRINRELSADFDVEQFLHHATFSPSESRMESYLISKRAQTVTVSGQRFELDAWEPIHTEVSCKYSHRRIDQLLQAAGLERLALFTDSEQRFADVACRRTRQVER